LHGVLKGQNSLDYCLLKSEKDLLCDSLWVLSLDWASYSHEEKTKFAEIVDILLQKRILADEEPIIHFDEEILKHCEIIDSVNQFHKRQNRIRTKHT